MLHMFGHGRRKENIILVPYVHSFFVCAFIHVLHGRLYYVSILLLHRQSRHTIVTTDWPLGLVVPNPSGTTRGPHVDVNSCQRQHEPDLRHHIVRVNGADSKRTLIVRTGHVVHSFFVGALSTRLGRLYYVSICFLISCMPAIIIIIIRSW